MSQEHPPKPTGANVRRMTPIEGFELLKVPFRRKVIRMLANGEMKTADELNAASGQTSAACRKQLAELCKLRILVKKENPQHGRKPRYGLAPDISVYEAGDRLIVDLGGCKLRFPR